MAWKLGAAVLAGGKSSRMGQNKVLLEYENIRFLDRICQELSGFDELLVSAAKKGDYADTPYQIVYDKNQEIGPIEGIRRVLESTSCDYVFICAGDMPFVKKELVQYMQEFISSDYDCYCLVDEQHVHPLCAIYSKAVLPVVEELVAEGQYRLLRLLNRVRTKYIKLESTCFDKKVVRNINTKEEYQRLVLPVVFCVSGVKDSGKTGLIIRLINEFIKDGYSVAVIKHDGHQYKMDYEGTDTYRFYQAGAMISAIYSDTQYSLNGRKKAELSQLIEKMEDADIIILEGQKASDYPKIEVVRKAISQKSVCKPDTLIALATDVVSPNEVPAPVYGLEDISGIYACLKEYFGLAGK